MSVTIPDYLEPFEGWRVWRIDSDKSDFRLVSVVQETSWPPHEELVAECMRRRILARLHRPERHQAPAEPCACGIYATTLDRLAAYMPADDPHTRYVFGRVRLWGTVIECEKGWRASRAYPAEIIVPAPQRAPRPGIMASPQPTVARASAEEIAHGLIDYAVPITVLSHPPKRALDSMAHKLARARFVGFVR